MNEGFGWADRFNAETDSPKVTDAWRETALRRLESLGRTAKTVAQAMDTERIKGGKPGDPEANPLAVWLQRTYGGIVKVRKDFADFFTKGNSVAYATVELPLGCRYFVGDYDQGAFPELMLDATKPTKPAA